MKRTGSSGIKNHLTEQDIENATGIIVAADVHVETDRFDGKNVVEVPVADGIKRPEELINKALDTESLNLLLPVMVKEKVTQMTVKKN